MSAIEMSSTTKFSYQRLRNEGGFEEEGRVTGRTKSSWYKIRKVTRKKRLKLKIPGLRRFLRRKARLFTNVRVSYSRILKRFKEGRSQMGDLFAGNYFFIQVSPSRLKCADKSFVAHNLHGLPSRYNLGRID